MAITFIYFSDNARETIAENWSDWLDELESILKRKRPGKRTKSVRDYWGIRLDPGDAKKSVNNTHLLVIISVRWEDREPVYNRS